MAAFVINMQILFIIGLVNTVVSLSGCTYLYVHKVKTPAAKLCYALCAACIILTFFVYFFVLH